MASAVNAAVSVRRVRLPKWTATKPASCASVSSF